MSTLTKIYERAREPSTHAALCGLFSLATYLFPDHAQIAGAIGIFFGVTGCAIPERTKPKL